MVINKALCILRSSILDRDVDRRNDKLIIIPNSGRLFDIETSLIDRDECEDNKKYLQITPYVTLIDNVNRSVYCYKRSEKDLEKRLQNRHSIGIGGHIELDVINGTDIYDVVTEETLRHLWTEVGLRRTVELFKKIKNYLLNSNFGLIYCNEDKVSKFHLCLSIFLPVKKSDIIVLGNSVVTVGEWHSPKELINLHNNGKIDLELWSKAVTYVLNEYT